MVAYEPLRRGDRENQNPPFDLQFDRVAYCEKKLSIGGKAVNQEHRRLRNGAKDRDIDRKQEEEHNAESSRRGGEVVDDVGWMWRGWKEEEWC